MNVWYLALVIWLYSRIGTNVVALDEGVRITVLVTGTKQHWKNIDFCMMLVTCYLLLITYYLYLDSWRSTDNDNDNDKWLLCVEIPVDTKNFY